MAKFIRLFVVAAAFLAVGMATAAKAYRIELDVGALDSGDSGHASDVFDQTDGLTSKQISTGAVTGDTNNEAEARAGADLATGELKVFVSATTKSGNPFFDSATASAGARFRDTVSFDFPGPTTSAEVEVVLTVGGTFTDLDAVCGSPTSCIIGNSLSAEIVLGPIFDQVFGGFGLLPGLTVTSPAVLSAKGVLDEGVDYGLRASLRASLKNPNDTEVAFDLTNTGAVSFVLPQDATFTSGSQVLLTQLPGGGGPGNGIPEPGTLALLGVGLFGLGILRRRIGT
jgi:hypothetical protein